MTPKKNVDPEGDDSLGVLDDSPSSDTTGLGLLGGTAQVIVAMPKGDDDDELVDAEVVDGEVVSDLIIDTSSVADADTIARIGQQSPEIVIELPADQMPDRTPVEETTAEVEAVDEAAASAPEIVIETDADDREPDATNPTDEQHEDESLDAEVDDAPLDDAAVLDDDAALGDDADASVAGDEASAVVTAEDQIEDAEPVEEATGGDAQDGHAGYSASDDAEARAAQAADAVEAEAEIDERPDSEQLVADERPEARTAEPAAEPAAEPEMDASALSHLESVVAAAKAELRDAMSPTPKKQIDSRPSAAGHTQEAATVATNDRVPAARPAADPARTPAESVRPTPEIALTSKRLDDLGSSQRESADLLTADRLLEPSRVTKPEPEGTWSHLLYSISGGRINVGDSRRARARKQLSARIAAPMSGTARFVPVLSRKGGVGKTTVTALLGMALADAREDRVIAVDANPDRGTLAERVVGSHTKSVRDMVRAQHDIRGFHDISALVARDETRLDVLASDADPRVSEAFGDADYRDVATVAAQYYSLVLTDSGTGIVHSVMGATLDLADQIVVVSGLSVDEARLASETLTWLETNGYVELAREAIVVLNQSTPGAPLVQLSELEAHFSTRAKHVLRIPYDPQIAGGGPIDFGSLQAATRQAAREIAATLVEGLRSQAA